MTSSQQSCDGHVIGEPGHVTATGRHGTTWYNHGTTWRTFQLKNFVVGLLQAIEKAAKNFFSIFFEQLQAAEKNAEKFFQNAPHVDKLYS